MASSQSRTLTPSPYLAGLLTVGGLVKLRRRPLAGFVELGVAAAAIQGISDPTVDRAAGLGAVLLAVRGLRARRAAGVPLWRSLPPLVTGVLGLACLTATTLVLDPDAPSAPEDPVVAPAPTDA